MAAAGDERLYTHGDNGEWLEPKAGDQLVNTHTVAVQGQPEEKEALRYDARRDMYFHGRTLEEAAESRHPNNVPNNATHVTENAVCFDLAKQAI